ncbi:MAG: ferritin family protein [Planctomycetes bacterium]|nr:ferritin family protein [Planctomycetota bacterium]
MFNADEILAIAEQIERNGVMFYNKAAGRFDSADTKRKFHDLAAMEAAHEKTFADMRRSLAEKGTAAAAFDPNGEAEMYLAQFADGRVFDLKADPAALLAAASSAQEVLRAAINLEKDSVVFYVGIKALVPESLGKHAVQRIIDEEMTHIALLGRELAALG